MPEPRSTCDRLAYPPDNRARALRVRDYAYARTQAGKNGRTRHPERGYAVATHFAEVIASRRRSNEPTIEREFHDLVAQWKSETGHLSSLTKAFAHPAYLRIIGLARRSSGHEIERLLLNELESDPDHWFAALSAVTGEDPVKPSHDFDGAVNAWLLWGRRKGII